MQNSSQCFLKYASSLGVSCRRNMSHNAPPYTDFWVWAVLSTSYFAPRDDHLGSPLWLDFWIQSLTICRCSSRSCTSVACISTYTCHGPQVLNSTIWPFEYLCSLSQWEQWQGAATTTHIQNCHTNVYWNCLTNLEIVSPEIEKMLTESAMSLCNLITESPFKSSSFSPFAMYILGPKLGFVVFSGSLAAKLRKPVFGFMYCWNGSVARNSALCFGSCSSNPLDGGQSLSLKSCGHPSLWLLLSL